MSSAAEDQERRFLHADSEKVKDSQRQRPAAPAQTQVLHQRALLQPQGGPKRAHVLYDHNVPGKSAGMEGLVLPVAPHCKSHDEVIGQPLQNTACVCWLLAGSSWKDFLTPSFSKHSKCSRNH